VSPEEALIELHKWRMNRQLPREDLWDPCAVFPDPVRVEKKRYREEFYHAAEDVILGGFRDLSLIDKLQPYL
jgi:hypothetical protein